MDALKPGESVDVTGGYIARSYSGESVRLSPSLPTYDAAVRWLENNA